MIKHAAKYADARVHKRALTNAPITGLPQFRRPIQPMMAPKRAASKTAIAKKKTERFRLRAFAIGSIAG
jgi:hypothetical protein